MSASTATLANNRQVGGQHYKTGGIEHWDLMHPAYLQGCASKYVARHTSKEGRQDLEKAIHYCEKYLERRAQEDAKKVSSWTYWQLSFGELLEWHSATAMPPKELRICYYILCKLDMLRAIELLRELIEIKYPEQPHVEGKFGHYVAGIKVKRHVDPAELPQNRPGTPEDGGHHARQPVEEAEGEVLWTLDRCDVAEKRLPPSLSTHDWQHRCSEAVQGCYQYDVSAARYLIKDDLRHYTHHCTARD